VAVPGGWVATMVVLEITVKELAGTVPNETAVAEVKFVPVMVTTVLPLMLPDVGDRALTVGVEATVYVK
jgi:hypothetical protein